MQQKRVHSPMTVSGLVSTKPENIQNRKLMASNISNERVTSRPSAEPLGIAEI